LTIALLVMLFGVIGQISAQSAREVAVELNAVKTANNYTELRWKSDTGVIRYFIYKRPHADSNWILLDSAVPSVLKFTDTQSRLGSSSEYRVAKKKNNYTFLGNGYIKAGFNLPAQSDKGIVLLVIDSNYIVPAKQDIQDYVTQLKNEGFDVVRKSVLRTESVSNIKSWIFQQWQKDSLRVKCLLLMGHVPVPYSGDIRPDGHMDHLGAWPADNYYGSFYFSWTDITVNRTIASRLANRNTPGDGKFDVSRLNPVGTTWKNTKRYQLPVGRIDFYDMPAFGSDTMLLKRYIKKNLAFRTKQVSFSPKGLVDDNFGYFAGEAFASGGYRNFSTFFGDSIIDADYTGTGTGMKTTKYLWSYGCGGGSYTSCGGVSNSSAMAKDSLLNPFTMLFGSYFGDWDNQNNFLRSPIASKGWGLASVWSGRPYWMMHEAALGAPLYQCVKSTYNCTNLYSVGSSGSGVHVALVGDPTLRVFPVANLKSVVAKSDCNRIATVKWQASTDVADSIVLETWQNAKWTLWGAVSGLDTQYIKLMPIGSYQISVREKKLMRSESGSWWDLGARSIVDILKIDNLAPTIMTKDIEVEIVKGNEVSVKIDDIDNGSYDDCGISKLTLTGAKTSFGCLDRDQTFSVTLTGEDASGNIAYATAKITVKGSATTAPSITHDWTEFNGRYFYSYHSAKVKFTTTTKSGYSYSWSGNDISGSTSGSSVEVLPTKEGNLTLTATAKDADGCTASSTAKLCVFNIAVPGSNNEKVYVCHNKGSNSVGAPDNVTLETSISGAKNHLTQHSKDGIGVCGTTYDCSKLSARSKQDESGVVGQLLTAGELSFMVYPNPSDDRFMVEVESEGITSVSVVRITDMLGRIVETATLNPNVAIEVGRNLIPGIYTISISNGGMESSSCLIKR